MIDFFWQFFISDAGQRALQNLLGLAALFLAVRGVRNWNQERRDVRRAELAERALASAYRCRDVIANVRSPIGYQGEGQSRKAEEGETPGQKQQRDSAFVPVERLNAHQALFEELASLAYSLDAAFGPSAADPLLAFNRARFKIMAAARSKFRMVDSTQDLTERDIARMERDDATIWSGMDNDEISKDINDAVALLEVKFRPYVEASFRRFRGAGLMKAIAKRWSRHTSKRAT
jgi:hypothetical protein